MIRMDRRQCLRLLGASAASTLAPGGLTGLFASSSDNSTKQDKDPKITELRLDEFIKEISKYNILHFGQVSPTRNKDEPTTIEDFVHYFLPRLRNQELVGKPYSTIRTENLPYEIDPTGETFISRGELKQFDQNGGGIVPDLTPNIFSEVFSGIHKEPRGSVRIAVEGTALGYTVRGLSPPVDYIKALERVTRQNVRGTEQQLEFIISLMNLHAVRDNYLRVLKQEIDPSTRMIFYGGAMHNDSKDSLKVGVAEEMKKQLPGKYVSIDLVKPSVTDPNQPYYQHHYSILRKRGIDPENLNRMVILRIDDDPTADYMVFLPKRKPVFHT